MGDIYSQNGEFPKMPFVAAEQPKCPKCGKSVYTAEERIAANAKWHKTCFKCVLWKLRILVLSGLQRCSCIQAGRASQTRDVLLEKVQGLCHKLLDSTNVTDHNGDLFCRHCYGRKFGPKGVGFGQGAGTLGMDVGEHLGNRSSEMTNAHHSTNY